MTRKAGWLICVSVVVAPHLARPAFSSPPTPPTLAFTNGRWFDGTGFEARTVYAVNGLLATRKPARVDRTIDLAGAWVVPPFADAHNHNIGTGLEDRERAAVRKFLSDGVFYVKIQGNLPLTGERRKALGLDRPDSIDVSVAQAPITASGGWPIAFLEKVLLPQGYYPGHTTESLRDHRYYTVDSEAELERKWPLVVGQRPDFLKTFLWFSDEFEKRKDQPVPFGQKGLDPALLRKVVEKAHRDGLRVSTHVSNAADFHHAVAAGVDEIAHLPLLATTPIAAEDARRAAERDVVVVTTCEAASRPPAMMVRAEELPRLREVQLANLKLLRDAKVPLAVGSDNVFDSSANEVDYLRATGLFDNLSLLRMWTSVAARTIFPSRKIGRLSDGYEASFLALEGSPLEDFGNVRRIRLRVKQGVPLPVSTP